MPASVFLTLAQTVVDALLAAPALAGGHVALAQSRPIPAEVSAAIEVRCVSAVVQGQLIGSLGASHWETLLGVEVYQRADVGETGHDAADALLMAVHQRLRGITWPAALRVAAVNLQPRITWQQAANDTPHKLVVLELVVQHDTQGDSLEAA